MHGLVLYLPLVFPAAVCLKYHVMFNFAKYAFYHWEKSTDPIYHKGSNPTGPIELSVQIPKISKETKVTTVKTQSETTTDVTYRMRDLYHGQSRLTYWLNRINADLEEPDRTDAHANRVFRLYIKSLGDKAVYRVEESVKMRSSITDILNKIRTPSEPQNKE